MPNIITQLTAFFALAILLNFADIPVLLALLFILMLTFFCARQCLHLRLLWRFRWFFVVMWLIFAFNTPGEYWAAWPFKLAPTLEGMYAASMQVLRIAVMLCALAALLASNTRQSLVSGLYYLSRPLCVLGLDVERFAVRLWLTLHYVEIQPKRDQQKGLLEKMQKKLGEILHENVYEEVSIILETPYFYWYDRLLILLIASQLAAIFWSL